MSHEHRHQSEAEGETSSPIQLSPEKRVTLPIVMIIGALGLAISATIGWTALQSDVKAATATANAANTTANEHEARLRALEKSQTQIATALEWIKSRMEEDRRRE